jgi:hypothetical protein
LTPLSLHLRLHMQAWISTIRSRNGSFQPLSQSPTLSPAQLRMWQLRHQSSSLQPQETFGGSIETLFFFLLQAHG